MTDSVLDKVYAAPTPKLVHPDREDFGVCGGPQVSDRAREWAREHHVYLVDGVNACAHGLAMANCVCRCRVLAGLDHTQLWAQVMATDSRGGMCDVFLLTQPYARQVPPAMLDYARAWGLETSSRPGDGWYGQGTVPVRLETDLSSVWPIERAVRTAAKRLRAKADGLSW